MKRKGWPLLLEDRHIVRSAGGIVSRIQPYNPAFGGTGSPAKGGIPIEIREQIVLVHRARHNDWSLPKGRLDPGETVEAAALREVQEETFCECILGEKLPTVRYIDRNGHPKEVRFWKMTLILANPFVPNGEIDEIRWLALEEALKALTYKTDRVLIKRAFASQPIPA